MLLGTYRSALEAGRFTNTKAHTDLEGLINDSDTIFITTPDYVISNVWHDMQGFNLKDKSICRTSDSLSSKVFSNINNSGTFRYSIHSMFPF